MFLKPKIYAHRGGAGYFVENTLAAFDFATQLGCDGAELDVQLSKDGEVMVYHDKKLNYRFTKNIDDCFIKKDDIIFLSDLNSGQLKNYTIGEPNPLTHDRSKWPNLLPRANQRIPTLAEVIDLAKSRSEIFELVIEIKCDLFDKHGYSFYLLVNKTIELIQSKEFSKRARICCSNWNALLYARSLSPTIPLWFITHPFTWLQDCIPDGTDYRPEKEFSQKLRQGWDGGNAAWYAGFHPEAFTDFAAKIKQAGGNGWLCYHSDANRDIVEHARNEGIHIALWSESRKIDTMNSFLLADSIFTDYPTRMLSQSNKHISKGINTAKKFRKEKIPEKALEEYHRLFSFFPDNLPASFYKNFSSTLRLLKNYSDSQKILENGLKFHPNDNELILEFAGLKSDLGKYKESLDFYIDYTNISSNFSAAFVIRFLKAWYKSPNLRIKNIFLDFLKISLENINLVYAYNSIILVEHIKNHKIEEAEFLLKFLEKTNEYLYKKIFLDYWKHRLKCKKSLIHDGKNFLGKIKKQDNKRIFMPDIASLIEICYFINDDFSKKILPHLLELESNYCFYSRTLASEKILNGDFVKLSQKICIILKNETNFSSDFPDTAWWILADISLLNHDFHSYWIAMNQARRKYAFGFSGNLENKARFLLENRDRENYYRLENEVGSDFLFSPSAPLYFGELEIFQKRNSKVVDKNFLEYIKNKKIAIVGPVNTGLESGDEIDGFDIVVRLNYRGKEFLNRKTHGAKTNISYYANDQLTSEIIDENIIKSFPDLDWIIYDGHVENILPSPKRHVYMTWHINPFYKGSANAIPKSIIDLALYQPQLIKVFNVNLWLSQGNIEGYHFGFKRNEISRFIRHDPLSNFIFMKNAYENNIIEADRVLSDILCMDPKDFIFALNDTYHQKSIGS